MRVMVLSFASSATLDEADETTPAFVTRAIPVQRAGAALITAIERRAARVGTPRRVLPMLAIRCIVTAVMDQVMLNNPRLTQAIDRPEKRATQTLPTPAQKR